MQFTPHYSFLHIHNLGNVFYILLPGYGVLSSSRLSLINLLKFLNPFLHVLTLYWASAVGYRAGDLGAQKWMSPATKGFRVNQGKQTWKQVGGFLKKYPGNCGRDHLWWVRQGFPLSWVPWCLPLIFRLCPALSAQFPFGADFSSHSSLTVCEIRPPTPLRNIIPGHRGQVCAYSNRFFEMAC